MSTPYLTTAQVLLFYSMVLSCQDPTPLVLGSPLPSILVTLCLLSVAQTSSQSPKELSEAKTSSSLPVWALRIKPSPFPVPGFEPPQLTGKALLVNSWTTDPKQTGALSGDWECKWVKFAGSRWGWGSQQTIQL